jgi:glycosyltransferase involved in cell wall biosynthesis
MSPRIAFYATIKPPDHPIPSGDRLVAANLLKALALAGYDAGLASRYIAYSKRSNPDILQQRKQGALAEAEKLIDAYGTAPGHSRPQIWLTYHPYCKAPDWIGPLVSQALDIPYVTVEAARTAQGVDDEWGPWRAEAQKGIVVATRHLVMKPSDRAYLSEVLGGEERLCPLPPFIDAQSTVIASPHPKPRDWKPEVPVIVTTGMMRKGKKDHNFYLLADILSGIEDCNWNLIVVGGGPEEQAVRAAFARFDPARILWTGEVAPGEVGSWMATGDVFVWPGWREPIGMVYLEAQLQGLPVVAYESLGVPLVVKHRYTGLLAPEHDIDAFRGHLRLLLSDRPLRQRLASKARPSVFANHSLAAASTAIRACLDPLLNG